MAERPIILDVGGGSGEWSRPYRLAGYDVRVIDPTVWPSWTAYECVGVYSGRPMLVAFGPYEDEWDGHTTDEKYTRLEALAEVSR